ncbi:hypothetical protein M378DRAFT_173884 [Amanita muscaria Koide BX008]|uniref:Uncharacterized protein n=1 Tax=Amanita muscaria (strain Koide BX008) TaxID=946122 RepID=A0A0C2WG50_AMAMK|nr:hypothetical protein M378DRAFT_173884 [Amanita muscaria Koide BX008]
MGCTRCASACASVEHGSEYIRVNRWATEALTGPSGPDRVDFVDDDVEQPGFNLVKPAASADVPAKQY